MNRLKSPAVLFLVFAFTRPALSVELAAMKITDNVLAVAKGENDFAADLYARLRSQRPGNLFFSPYGISAALAMTYAGAAGPTKTQMAEALRFPLSEEELHPAMNALRALLTGSDDAAGFQLRVANRLWGQDGLQFRSEFLQIMKADYGADLGQLDFKQAEVARKTINAWVDEQTNHKIQDLVAPGVVSGDTRLLLTNAIYFKSRWTHEFSKQLTADAPFHVSSAAQMSVPTMRQTHRLRYAATDSVQVLELPYAQDGNLGMLILLPTRLDGLSSLEKQLTGENLLKWSSGLQLQEVDVRLPKFKMTAEFSLKDVLEAMGMALAFSTQADFSKMSSQEQLFIAAVIHKAFVDVNEEGTEAAAATAVTMRPAAAFHKPEKPVEFRADHPFLFLIRDSRTRSILFLGSVTNPKS